VNKAGLAAALAMDKHHGGRHHALHWLIHLGAVGLFGIAILDAWPFPLPIPGTTDLLLLVLVARQQSLWLMVPLAVAGAIVGGLITWTVGKRGGEPALQRYVPERYYDRITGWVKHNGFVAVVLAAMLPPPIPLMPFLVAAGALGVPKGRFTWAFGVGRAARYSLIAWLGIVYGHPMIRWWNRYLADYSGAIAWAIFGIFLAGAAWAIWKWRRSKAHHSAQPVHS